MSWFCNYYICTTCDYSWEDEWSCMCDDECPECGAADHSPIESDDLTAIMESDGENYNIFVSPSIAENSPDYELMASTASPLLASMLMKIAKEFPDKFLSLNMARS